MIFRSKIITHFTSPKSAIVTETDKPITQVVLYAYEYCNLMQKKYNINSRKKPKQPRWCFASYYTFNSKI